MPVVSGHLFIAVLEINVPFFKDGIFYRLLHCSPIENVWEIWHFKIDFGWPYAKVGQ